MKRICKNCGYIDVNEIAFCPICSKNEWEDYDIHQIKQISTDESFVQAMIKLHDADLIEYQLKLQQLKNAKEQEKQIEEDSINSSKQQKCRYCGSTSFTPVRRKWSPIMGFFTNKIDLVCNNCGKKI